MTLPETIRTERLELRPFALADAPAVLAYSQDADWREYQQSTPHSKREAESAVVELMERDWNEKPAWAITNSEGVVGIVSLVFSAAHRIVLLGYGIHEALRGRGLTSEAIRAVLSEAFELCPQLTRVTAQTHARNKRSNRLLENLGFTLEGTLRSGGVTASGQLVDGAIYGLLRSEWAKAPAS